MPYTIAVSLEMSDEPKRLIINDYRSFCFCASTLSSGIFGRERGPFRGNV